MKPIVVTPEVSKEELDTALGLGLASLKTCRDVCNEKELDLSVAITALTIALTKCAQDYGMGTETLIQIVRELSEPAKPGN